MSSLKAAVSLRKFVFSTKFSYSLFNKCSVYVRNSASILRINFLPKRISVSARVYEKKFTPRRDENLFSFLLFLYLLFFTQKRHNKLSSLIDRPAYTEEYFFLFFFSFIFREDEAIIKTESEEKNNKNHRRGFFFRRVLFDI